MSEPGTTTEMALASQRGRAIPRKQVLSWAMWDWAGQPFNTVILTFIFVALYLTTDVFLPPEIAALGEESPEYQAGIAGLTAQLGLVNFIAGVLIAILAPVLGQRSDGTGRRKRALAISTGLVVLCTAALFFVEGAPEFFLLGVSLVAAGSVFNEIAGVHYNAMLVQVSTPATVGRVSGLGWGLGYLGGIFALVIVVVAYISDWFGLDQENGLPFRVVAVGCAVWIAAFAVPIFLNVPEPPASRSLEGRPNFFASYILLGKHVVRLYRETRPTFWFLLASAVFRDGLAGVFTYGAVIASAVFGFDFLEVVIFGIAANLVAGVSTIVSGRFDDRFGPRAVILTSLVGLCAAGLAVFLFRDAGDVIFWVGGLILCLFVGPAQASSRSFLARVTPAGREGEVFGLYATTGRAASFLAPGLWTLLIALSGSTAWGILGIVVVLLVGLLLMLPVRAKQSQID